MSVNTIKVLATLVLCAATLVLFHGDFQYQTVAAELLPNLGFEDGFAHWEAASRGVDLTVAEQPTAVLTVGAGALLPLLTRSLPDPQRFDHLRVAAEVETRRLEPGDEPWERGGVVFHSYGPDGSRLSYWPSAVGLVAGTADWRRYETVFPVSEEAASMRLFIFAGGTSGAMAVRDVALEALDEAAWFATAERVALMLWVGMVLWAALPLLRRGERREARYLTLVVAMAIAAGLLAPQPQLSNTVAAVGERALRHAADVFDIDGAGAVIFQPATATASAAETGTLAPAAARRDAAERVRLILPLNPEKGDGKLFGVSHDLIAHLFLHALFAVVVARAFPMVPWSALVVYLLTIAAASEVMQVFSLTRSVQLGDGALNMAGVLIGLTAFAVGRRVIGRLGRGPGSGGLEPAL